MRALIAVPFVLLPFSLASVTVSAQQAPGGARNIAPALAAGPVAVGRAIGSGPSFTPQPPAGPVAPGATPSGKSHIRMEQDPRPPTHCAAKIIKVDPSFMAKMPSMQPDPNTRFELLIIVPPACPTTER